MLDTFYFLRTLCFLICVPATIAVIRRHSYRLGQTSICIRAVSTAQSSISEVVPLPEQSSIRSITLKNWGVFADAKLVFPQSMGFVALSGETGSGKSVFLSALQYSIGETSSVKVRTTGAEDGNMCSVQLIMGDSEMDKVRSFERIYYSSNKKSICQIGGQKILVRELQQLGGKSFRFWSTDAIEKLDNEGFMTYIDRFIGGAQVSTLHHDVSTTYASWRKEREHLMYLRKMEHKAENEDEVQLMNDYSEELSKFYEKFDNLKKSMSSWLQAMHIETSKDSGTFSSSNANLALVQTLVTMDDTWRWDDFISCEDYFRKYAKQISDLNPTKASPATSSSIDGSNKKASLAVPISAPVADFKTTERFLDTKLREVEQLQSTMAELGVLSERASNHLSDLQSSLHESLASLQVIAKQVSDLKSYFPDVSVILQKFVSLRSEWESLSRKHNTTPSGLNDKYSAILAELKAIQDVWSLLPNQIRLEKAAFDAYAQAASRLSQQRSESAARLQKLVNNLLPSLDMGDKQLKIEITSYDPEEMTADRGECREDGWDSVRVSLVLSPHSSISSFDENQSTSPPFPTDQDRTAKMLFTPSGNENSLRSILSSGEAARLALALETISDDDSQANDQHHKRSSLPILVLDEIDAHIGGDAAVAVAKLLKKQGRRRQVLVVTHNPVIAAAADCHLMVRRTRPSYDVLANEMQQSSEIRILTTQEEREMELCRMATGRLNITAGMDLAKALLSTDFTS